jgi:hypothetical protein
VPVFLSVTNSVPLAGDTIIVSGFQNDLEFQNVIFYEIATENYLIFSWTFDLHIF